MATRVGLWGPVVVYMAAIFWLSSLSFPPRPPVLSDKAGHLLLYAGLGAVIVRALAGGLPARIGWGPGLMAVAITAVYGVTDELHQLYVHNRSAEIGDVYADALGGATGTLLCALWGIIARSRLPNEL
ncbi:MAG: VanZ family protein [Acidimicrobiia bacterium]|nr:VanZ family protein [Acidimicrobiia bacterium]